MLRLIAYFALSFLALLALQRVPFLGAIFRVPFLGFFLAAALVSAVSAWLARVAVDRAREKRMQRSLGVVDTPHNQGKLGTLILLQGRAARAIPHLERAVAGDPERAEWRYRLGSALLAKGRGADAVRELSHAAKLDEEHAFGNVLLRLAEALSKVGDAQAALAALERFERNHGPSAESAYRRALALKKLDRRADARRALDDVGRLAAQAARFQRNAARGFALRAWWAKLMP